MVTTYSNNGKNSLLITPDRKPAYLQNKLSLKLFNIINDNIEIKSEEIFLRFFYFLFWIKNKTVL